MGPSVRFVWVAKLVERLPGSVKHRSTTRLPHSIEPGALDVADGVVTNVANDAQVPRTTVYEYFEIHNVLARTTTCHRDRAALLISENESLHLEDWAKRMRSAVPLDDELSRVRSSR
jgi:hypothetical protein